MTIGNVTIGWVITSRYKQTGGRKEYRLAIATMHITGTTRTGVKARADEAAIQLRSGNVVVARTHGTSLGVTRLELRPEAHWYPISRNLKVKFIVSGETFGTERTLTIPDHPRDGW